MIISHAELKSDYLFGKEDLLDGTAEPTIDKQITIAEAIVKTDLNVTTLVDTEINKALVAYYTLFLITSTSVIKKEGKSIYKEMYDELISKLRIPPIGLSIIDFTETEEEES
jgi:hypothetical protein